MADRAVNRPESAFGVPLDIHYDDGSPNFAVDETIQGYE